MIKLFVTDIDGTLLPVGSAVVPEKNVEAVKAMTAAGVKVVIATGRMHGAALSIAAQLGASLPIISFNGALIKSSAGEVLHAQYMEESLVVELINFFEERGWHLQSYSGDELYVPKRNSLVEFYEKMIRVKAVEVGWDGLRARTKDVPKLDATKKIFDGRAEITRSAARFTEFMSLGVSKAGAIKILAEKFGVDNSEVMAIGDSENDLAMITSVGCGVAMGNAVDAVKAAAPHITDTCENFGFAKAVYDFVL